MYTTHGYMTQADYAEYLKDTDQGSTYVDPTDPPEWFEWPGDCPVCGQPVAEHSEVLVSDASGEIFACHSIDGGWQPLVADPDPIY
jgi:hypothetical protein